MLKNYKTVDEKVVCTSLTNLATQELNNLVKKRF